jgi:hypothetical protein
MWLTGDTKVYGSIYSSYGKRANGTLLSMSPFNITDDSRVEGTINTILTQAEINSLPYQLETVGANGQPLFYFGGDAFDSSGNPVSGSYGPSDEFGFLLDSWLNPVFGENGQRIAVNYDNRYYGSGDEVQGYHPNIKYDQSDQSDMSGMSIADYDTSEYKSAIPATAAQKDGTLIYSGELPTTGYSTVTEYFPHASGSYTTRASNSSLPLKRYVYDGLTLKNVVVKTGTNALFKNCTFEEVLYVDTNSSGPTVSFPSNYYTSTINSFLSTTKNYNNIRFEN